MATRLNFNPSFGAFDLRLSSKLLILRVRIIRATFDNAITPSENPEHFNELGTGLRPANCELPGAACGTRMIRVISPKSVFQSRREMKIRTIALILALCLVGLPVGFAQEAFMGIWKLKEAQSEFSPGAPRNSIVVYVAEGDKVKVTVDSVSSDGKPTHNLWTGKFDSQEYPVTGDPLSDGRSYTKIDDRILGFNIMKGGRVTTSGRIVVSGDGKSRTVTTSGADAKGHRVSKNEVYEKQ